ncbi:hypothetical protein HG531_000025 [Fusarium graminearum]|nr:hypothetical protein HG531_000025 [Fusarium graminearum]
MRISQYRNTVIVAGAESLEVDVGRLDGAELAIRGSIGVGQVTTSCLDVRIHILSAGGSVGGIKRGQLIRRALHLCIRNTSRQNSRHEIGKWRNTVHPDPEAGHLIGRRQNTTEEERHHEDDVGQVTTCFSCVGDGDGGVGKGTREDEELPDEQPHETTAFGCLTGELGVLVEADRVTQRSIEEHKTEKQSNLDTQSSLGVDVRGGAPVLLKDTFSGDEKLLSKGRSKLAVRLGITLLINTIGTTLSLEALKLSLDSLVLGAVSPRLMPVDVGMGTRCCANNLKHPLSRVLAIGTFLRAVLDEIVGQSLGVLANVTKTLALFNIETLTEDTDDCICVLLHVQQLDNFINVGDLLFTRRGSGLTKKSAESQSLANGAGFQVKILLLHVACSALERGVADLAVDKHFTSDDTHRDTISETVEKSSLSSTRHTHQGCECSGLDPAVNVVENASWFTLDLDVVAHVVPVENTGGTLDVGDFVVVLLGHVAAAEDEDLTLGLLGGDELGGDDVDDVVEDCHGDENTHVAPLVSVEVLVLEVDVGVAVDVALTWDGANC